MGSAAPGDRCVAFGNQVGGALRGGAFCQGFESMWVHVGDKSRGLKLQEMFETGNTTPGLSLWVPDGL